MLFLVIAMGCRVHVFARGRSLVQMNPTECDVSNCDLKPQERGSLDPLGLSSHERRLKTLLHFIKVT
jgi:hypothetical protein